MRRFVGSDDDIVVESRRCIVRNGGKSVWIFNPGGVVFDNKPSVRVLVFHMHSNCIIRSAACHGLYGSREHIYCRLVRGHNELLLGFDDTRDTTDRVELDVVQRKIISDMERVGIEVHYRNRHLVAILIGVERLGVLVPYIIAEFRFAQIQYG